MNEPFTLITADNVPITGGIGASLLQKECSAKETLEILDGHPIFGAQHTLFRDWIESDPKPGARFSVTRGHVTLLVLRNSDVVATQLHV